MKLNDFYNEVAKRADTAKSSINVAETKRVLSEAFLVLSELNPAELCDTLAKGLAQAQKKSGNRAPGRKGSAACFKLRTVTREAACESAKSNQGR